MAETATIAGTLAVFALLATELELEGPKGFWWERRLTHFLIGQWGNGLVRDARHFSHYVGSWQGLLLIAGAGLIPFAATRASRSALIVGLAPAAILVTPLLKEVFRRPPPQVGSAHMYAFPSGHAAGTMAVVAALVAVLWHTRLRWPALGGAMFVAGGVGAAVVADQGHWPSDVVAGWALGLAWVAIVRLALARLGPRLRRRIPW